jgi:histone deacetylase 1/2
MIRTVTPENRSNFEDQLYRFNFKEDCPVMERLYDYCVSYTTGSISISFVIKVTPN